MKSRNWDSLLDRPKEDKVKALLKQADKLLSKAPAEKDRKKISGKKWAKKRTQELKAKERYQKSLAGNQWAVTK